MLLTLFWLLTLLGLVLILTYRRSSLRATTVVLGLWLALWVSMRQPHGVLPLLAAAAYAALLALNLTPLRVAFISRPFLRIYKRLLPTMSST
jgi:acyl-CoA dehydrogenase